MEERALAITGKLQDVHPAKLYVSFFKARKTGRLTLSSGPSDALVPLVDGAPTYVRRRGDGDDARERFRERVLATFRFRQGQYRFVDGGFPAPDDRPPRPEFARLVLDGVRAGYDARAIRAQLSGRLAARLVLYRHGPLAAPELPLAPEERRLYNAILTGAPLGRVLALPGNPPEDDAARIVYGLLVLEVFKFEKAGPRAAPRPRPPAGDPRVERIIAEAARSVDQYVITQARPRKLSPAEAIRDALRYPVPDDVRAADLGPPPAPPGRDPAPSPPEAPETIAPPVELDAEDEDYRIETEPIHGDAEPEAPPPGPFVPRTARPAPPDPADEGSAFRLVEGREEQERAARERGRFAPGDTGETLYKMGLLYLDEGDYRAARLALEEAVVRGHERPEVLAQLGWAIYKDPMETRPARLAQETALRAVRMQRGYFFAYVILGRIARDERDLSMAELWFAKAQEMNRDCQEAIAEIRKLHQARPGFASRA